MKAKLMTKLALAAAVVAFGLAAQAEQLYWSAYDVGSSDDNKLTKADQYIAYIFVGNKNSSSTMFQSGCTGGEVRHNGGAKVTIHNCADVTQD